MKKTTEQRLARTVLAASIAAIFSAPAFAQEDDVERLIRPDSEIEVGVGHVSQDSFKYGDYRGLFRSGPHLIGNVDINQRGKDNARYTQIQGSNLGIDSRSLGVQMGEQGNFGVRLEYDQIPKYTSDTFLSPFNNLGNDVLTNPGITRAGNVAGMQPALNNNLKQYDIDSMRKSFGLGFTKQLMKEWDVEMNFRREKKDGTKLMAAMMQIGAQGARGALFVPEPVDYTTDQYEAMLRYTTEKMQLQLAYNGSLFNNDRNSLTWDNLFTGGNATGRYHLPPDNESHQVGLSGGYALTPATRVTGALSFGRMTQNDPFLPYSTGATPTVPPSGSLDGKVQTVHGSLKVTTKLMPKLQLMAGMKYDDRDNKTPIALFRYITGDNGTGQGALGGSAERLNMPLDIKKQVYFADLDYHLGHATTLKFGYDFHKVDHNYEPTTGDKEHTVKTEVRHRFGDTLSAGLSYAHSDRDADGYNGAAPLASTYAATYLAGLCSTPNPGCTGGAAAGKTFPWLEAPTLRKYYLADRERDKLGANVNFAPHERVDLQFGGNYTRDKYPETDVYSGIGLTKATGWMLSFDATVAATDALNGNFFASLDEYETDQTSAHLTNGVLSRAAETGTIPASNLAVTSLRDRTLTVGLGVNYKPARKYEVGGNITHSDSTGRSNFAVVGGTPSGFTVAPLPDLESRLNRVEMFGRYFWRKDTTVNLKYAYERYRSKDWAWDAPMNIGSVTSVVGSGHVSPQYNVHFVGVTLAHQF